MKEIYRHLGQSFFIACLSSTVVTHAQANKAKEQAAPVRYCIEDFCLNDPISKFNASQVKPNQIMLLGTPLALWKKLSETYPVCKYEAQHIDLVAPSGRIAKLTFYPYAAPQGSHYRVGEVSMYVPGQFTRDQARKLYEEKKVGPLAETKPFLSTFAASIGYKSKEFGVIGYYLDVGLQKDNLNVAYRHTQFQNQELLIKQDGCSSQIPKL